MPRTPAGMRECPTRADGAQALFAHAIGVGSCQERQREHYHKCPTCAYFNARAGFVPSLPARNGQAQPALDGAVLGNGAARPAASAADVPAR